LLHVSGDEVAALQRQKVSSKQATCGFEKLREMVLGRHNVENALKSQFEGAEEAERLHDIEPHIKVWILSLFDLMESDECLPHLHKSHTMAGLLGDRLCYQRPIGNMEEKQCVRYRLQLAIQIARKRQMELRQVREKYDALMPYLVDRLIMPKDETNKGANDQLLQSVYEMRCQFHEATNPAEDPFSNLAFVDEMFCEDAESHQRTERELAATKLLADKLKRELEDVKTKYQLKQEVVKATQIRQLEGLSNKSGEMKELLLKLVAVNPHSTTDNVTKSGTTDSNPPFYLSLGTLSSFGNGKQLTCDFLSTFGVTVSRVKLFEYYLMVFHHRDLSKVQKRIIFYPTSRKKQMATDLITVCFLR